MSGTNVSNLNYYDEDDRNNVAISVDHQSSSNSSSKKSELDYETTIFQALVNEGKYIRVWPQTYLCDFSNFWSFLGADISTSTVFFQWSDQSNSLSLD
jgi:hypothetical protein